MMDDFDVEAYNRYSQAIAQLEIPEYHIHDLCEEGNYEKIQELLNREYPKLNPEQADNDQPLYDFNQSDPDGLTPLHIAILHLRDQVCELLIKYKHIDLYKTTRGSSYIHLILMIASFPVKKYPTYKKFAYNICKLLVENNADVTLLDDLSRTVFHLCAKNNLIDCFKVLESSSTFTKEILNKQDIDGNTIAHYACQYKSLDILEYILSNKDISFDATICNNKGYNLLHTCASVGFWSGCKLVVKYTTLDFDSTTSLNLTPSQISQRYGYEFLSNDELKHNLHTAPTALIWSPMCSKHLTSKVPILRQDDERPPSENLRRLSVLLNSRCGILRSNDNSNLQWIKSQKANMVDVLRTHHYEYVRKVQLAINDLVTEDDPIEWKNVRIGHLDNDTSYSSDTFNAALYAAGAGILAVDRVVNGVNRNAFCAIRPPGHHAGPNGKETSIQDPTGSHGFCF